MHIRYWNAILYLLLIYHFFAGASEGLPLIFLSFISTGSVIVLHSLIYPVTRPNTSFKIVEKQDTYQDIYQWHSRNEAQNRVNNPIHILMESLGIFQQSVSKLPIVSLSASCIASNSQFTSHSLVWMNRSLQKSCHLDRRPGRFSGVATWTFFSIPKSCGRKWGRFKQCQNQGDNCFWKHLYQISLYLSSINSMS